MKSKALYGTTFLFTFGHVVKVGPPLTKLSGSDHENAAVMLLSILLMPMHLYTFSTFIGSNGYEYFSYI